MLLTNLRLALRDFRHNPTFAVAVVLTLAIGIGATTAAFALVDAVFLTRLPVADQQRLVTLAATPPSKWGASGLPWSVPWEIGRVLNDQRRTLVGVADYIGGEANTHAARYHDRTVHVADTWASGNFFDVLGVRAALGRVFTAEDDVAGGPSVVVLSDHAWRAEFGADPHVIGQPLFLTGIPHCIIGVAPAEFSFPSNTDVWVPAIQERYARFHQIGTDDVFGYFLIGRLQKAASPASARAEMIAALRAFVPTLKFLKQSGDVPTGAVVERYTDVVIGREVRSGVIVIFAAVTLVLAVACANVGGLLLARGIGRTGEFAVRSALGATPRHIMSHLLTEAGLLAVFGGLLGLVVSALLLHAAIALAPAKLPMVAGAHLDGRVIAFASGITLLAVIGFGLSPALRASRAGVDASRQFHSRSTTADPATRLTRRVLVAAQVALAIVVLSGAGLLEHTLAHLQHIPLGFVPDNLLLFRLDIMLPSSPERDTSRAWQKHWRQVQDQIVERIAASPGLGPVTMTMWRPFSGEGHLELYTADGRYPTAGVKWLRKSEQAG